MTTIWTASVGRAYQAAIDQLERALRECPDELWEESLWEVKKEHHGVWPVRRIDDKPSRSVANERLLQVYSAFWNVAYHAIFHLDFYLSGGSLKGFAPPAPFREAEHRAHVVPNRAYSRAELMGYIAHDRAKARATLEGLTEDQAKRLVPRAGVPFAEFLLNNVTHAREHAAQLNLFLGQHGVEPRAGAAAEQARSYLRAGVRGRSDAEIDAFVKSISGYARLLPLVFAGFCKRLHPREDCAVRFDLGGAGHFFILAAPGGASFEPAAPKSVEATVHTSPQDFLRWMTADLDYTAATATGRITVDGDTAAIQRLFETALTSK